MSSVSTKPQVSSGKQMPQKRILLRTLHTLVLLASLALIVLISWDAFHNISFIANETYLKIQLWICLFFMFDCIVEFFLYPKKASYVASHIFFFLISIPYLNILTYLNVHMSPEALYHQSRCADLLVCAMVGFYGCNDSGMQYKRHDSYRQSPCRNTRRRRSDFIPDFYRLYNQRLDEKRFKISYGRF